MNVNFNVKHKAILMLMYSEGLMVEEVARLKPEDMDLNRKLIHILEPQKAEKIANTLFSNVAFQTLRVATHLLESGIDLRYIQELLCPKSSKITEIYTHVSTKNLSAIKNPLDSLLKGGET